MKSIDWETHDDREDLFPEIPLFRYELHYEHMISLVLHTSHYKSDFCGWVENNFNEENFI